jgi:DNA-binding MarR family transcriptional regulator
MASSEDQFVDEFFEAVLVMGRFLKGCTDLPMFRTDITLLQCLVLFVLSKEPAELPIKVLCRRVGLSQKQALALTKSLRDAGLLSIAEERLVITPRGLSKLAELDRRLLPALQRGVDDAGRLRNVTKQVRLVSRIWSARDSPPRAGKASPGDAAEGA